MGNNPPPSPSMAEHPTGDKTPQAFYDEIWKDWHDMEVYAPAPRYIRRMVLREMARLDFKSVLDVGCGEGTLLQLIARRHPSATLAGCELSETALLTCRQGIPNGHFFRLDLERDEVPAGSSYDLLTCVQVLEHVQDDLTALTKIRQMCGKYALISVPGGKLDERGRRNGHYRHYTTADLRAKMERTGFHVRRIFTCGWPMHSLVYRQLVRHLPQDTVEKVGLGRYSPAKKALLQAFHFLNFLNLPFAGTEVIAVATPLDHGTTPRRRAD